ncbi:hypothetical protein [Longitalea luteola]|uniref:hypothetical protein n=1 Tax=Longitalea luteola TaxID=2812563 RepID=UPI001A972CA3|nr:hypothetical protein [Longitalea luteola]
MNFYAKITWCVLLAYGWLPLAAQQHEIARAEQAFAQMAIDSGAKKAFLHFLDSNSLLFHRGQAHAGLPFWSSLPEKGPLIYWKPVYTGMAISGDIGFSTGPFEGKNSPAGPVLESGNYNSIWVKNKQGEWKVLIDIGVPYKPSQFHNDHPPRSYRPEAPVTRNTGWQKVEGDFIAQFKQLGNQAFLQYLSEHSWFNIAGRQPLHTVKDIQAVVQQIPADLQFECTGGAQSAAGDLVYAYGTVARRGSKENYLRVWGYQKEGWKLLLQVLK